MKIVCVHSVENFVSHDKPLMGWQDLPIGMAIISSILRDAGHQVLSLVVNPNTPMQTTIRELIDKENPQLFAMSAVSTQFPLINKVAETVKSINSNIPIIVGGHHATLKPDDAISSPFIDAICVGEGDHSVVTYVQKLEAGEPFGEIENLWIKDPVTREVRKSGRAGFLQDLDSVPFVDRKLWQNWVANPDFSSVILVGRGCPYRCTYCANHVLQKLGSGAYFRMRSAQNIIAEINEVVSLYPNVGDIYLEIETIVPRHWIDLAKELAQFNSLRERPIRFGVNMALTNNFMHKTDLISELFSAFDDANIRYFNIGLESGSEMLRNTTLRRPDYSNESFIKFCQIARENQIEVNAYVLLGLPGETIENYKETVDVVRKSMPARVFLSIFYPYAGTDLYDIAVNEGYLDADHLSTTAERSRPALNLPSFPRHRIMLEYYLFYYKAYRGIWPAHKIFIHVAWTFAKSFPMLRSFVNRLMQNSNILSVLMSRYKMVSFVSKDSV